MKKLTILIAISVAVSGCSATGPTANNTNTSTTTAAENSAPANRANTSNSANTVANKPAEPVKPADSGPKRVTFSKGATSSTQTITLAPGATAQFILGATGAQTLFVEPGSKELSFKMLKGIGGEFVKADDGTYSAETKGNNAAKGDILFEVKNSGTKEIKTTLKISIEDFGD